MSSRIKLDRYVYEDIYPAFKAATDEKQITANINRTFLNYLAKRNLILTGDSPVAVADIGCGPCDTLIKYLTGVVFGPSRKCIRREPSGSPFRTARRNENATRVPHRIRISCDVSRRGVVGGATVGRGCGEQCSRSRRRLYLVPYCEHARDI